jgi:hypothetical protein
LEQKHIAVGYILSVCLPFFSLSSYLLLFPLYLFLSVKFILFWFFILFAKGIVVPKCKQNFLPQVCVRTVDFVRKDFLLVVILHSLREGDSYYLARTKL